MEKTLHPNLFIIVNKKGEISKKLYGTGQEALDAVKATINPATFRVARVKIVEVVDEVKK